MAASTEIAFSAPLERKHPALPVYVVVPYPTIAAWQLSATAVVEGSVNGHAIGRRTIKRWDATTRSPWFVEFTAPFCKTAGIGVGEQLDLRLRLAATGLPPELDALVRTNPELRARWDALSAAVRRTSMEYVRAGKAAATRERRAAAVAGRLLAPHPQR